MPSPEDVDCVSDVYPHNGNGHHHYEDSNDMHVTISEEHHHHHHHHLEEDDDGQEERKNGRHRPRKKKLYGDICKQMEFYFSDANITKNRMMREIIEQADEGFVDLTAFLEFTKIQRLNATISHLRKALVASEKLELSSDGLKARRKVAFDPAKVKSDNDVEECTIYVENIPRDSAHEWLDKIFQEFGPIAYVSLPKFKSGQHKGFGFVEFDDVESARRCLEAYGEEGACLPNDIDPAELRSIQSFKEEEGNKTPAGRTPDQVGKTENNGDDSSSHKRKASGATADEPQKKKSKHDSSIKSEPAASSSEEEETQMNTEEVKSRKRKRKKNKAKKTVEDKLESESIVLKVLPKKSWRQLRNRYLNLQRSNMSKLKKQLQKQYVREQHFKNFYKPPQNSYNHDKQNHRHKDDYQKHEEEYHETKLVDHVMEVDMKVKEIPESADVFRHKISIELAEQDEDEAMISGFIKFIDYKDNEAHAYVRINGDESFENRATNLLKRTNEYFSSARFLSAQELEEYKQRVQAQLKQKHKEQPSRKNIRGKDRLMKAATKSHIRFESSDDEEEVKVKTEIEVKKETSA